MPVRPSTDANTMHKNSILFLILFSLQKPTPLSWIRDYQPFFPGVATILTCNILFAKFNNKDPHMAPPFFSNHPQKHFSDRNDQRSLTERCSISLRGSLFCLYMLFFPNFPQPLSTIFLGGRGAHLTRDERPCAASCCAMVLHAVLLFAAASCKPMGW